MCRHRRMEQNGATIATSTTVVTLTSVVDDDANSDADDEDDNSATITDGPASSSSNYSFDATRNVLLQQALSQAAAVRAQQQAIRANIIFANTMPTPIIMPIDHISIAAEDKSSTAIRSTTIADESIKRAIVAHPLFPVLETMLLKCEDATTTMSPKAMEIDDVIEMLQKMKNDGTSIHAGNTEIDQLLIDIILLLRVNLIELAKVADLCNDFRSKYIQSIKRKINQEAIIGFANDSDDDSLSGGDNNGTDRFSPSINGNENDSSGAGNGGSHHRNRSNVSIGGGGTIAMLTTSHGTVAVSLNHFDQQQPNRNNNNNINDIRPSIASTSFQSPPKSMDHRISPVPSPPTTTIAAAPPPSSSNAHMISYDDDAFNYDHQRGPGRKSSLPKKAVDELKDWLFRHVTHPYPTESEKVQLSHDTGLSLIQVNNWFINARRRILQPMLDGGTESPPINQQKKRRLSSSPISNNCVDEKRLAKNFGKDTESDRIQTYEGVFSIDF